MPDCPKSDSNCPAFELTDHIATFREYRKAMDRRLETLNELRKAVEKDRDLYLHKDVYNVRHEEIVKRASELAERVKLLEDWQSRLIGIGTVVALLAVVTGVVIGHVIK